MTDTIQSVLQDVEKIEQRLHKLAADQKYNPAIVMAHKANNFKNALGWIAAGRDDLADLAMQGKRAGE